LAPQLSREERFARALLKMNAEPEFVVDVPQGLDIKALLRSLFEMDCVVVPLNLPERLRIFPGSPDGAITP